MRILIIHDSGASGGPFRFLKRLLSIHRDNGLASLLLIPDDVQEPAFYELGIQYAVPVISRSNRNQPGTLSLLTPFGDLLFSWREVLNWQPDLIIVSTTNPGRMSAIFYFPCPVLYVLHSAPDQRFSFWAQAYLRLGTSWRRNMVMTVSSAAAHMIESYMGIPGEKIRVVHNSSPVLPRPVVDRRPLILTVGHMEEYKNPVGWLEVAELVIRQRPDVGFVWLGEGKLRAQIREDVACRGMAGQVNLPGYTEETASWYDQAQIYFQPSLKESHGIAVLEAMAHGLPCIVSDREGLPESVINGKTGFVCPVENSAMFASCILRLLDESSLRQQMGAEGRLRIFECFSVEVQEKKILSLYDYLQGQA